MEWDGMKISWEEAQGVPWKEAAWFAMWEARLDHTAAHKFFDAHFLVTSPTQDLYKFPDSDVRRMIVASLN